MTSTPLASAPVNASAIANPARTQKHKICIASMAPFMGGAEVAAERLALGLQRVGHEVLVLLGTNGPVFQKFEQSGLRCIHAAMPFTDKWHWWRYRKARNFIRGILCREQPDVVHSNDLPTH